MGKFKLAIGLHNHQPVGNFDFVFEDAHRQAYRPFLDLFKQYPQIRISLHQSGILWDWQDKHHPDYMDDVKNLVHEGRLELLSGGFYEPILSSIPTRDILGQFEHLNNYLSLLFGAKPTGCWLTERIWEPHLPKVLSEAGVKYLPVDDTHFIYAGFDEAQLSGPFVTEYENHAVTLLPISKKLRYLIPFGTVDDLINHLKKLAEKNPDGVAVYADDGEKFGSWPKTHDHCYKDRWLAHFFEAVLENSDWLEIVPLNVAAIQKPVGRAYLPTASYAEMLHWALPADAFEKYEQFEHWLKNQGQLEEYGRFVRGGHWRGFLTKYEEVNLMHKKMMAVSSKLESLKDKFSDNENYRNAKDKLYAGQCNCPYWHGVFGGLYLPHIRQAIFANLSEADFILDRLSKAKPSVTSYDYDCDGQDEIILKNEHLFTLIDPSEGGKMLEISASEPPLNFTDTLMRRIEGYHKKLALAVTSENSASTASIHDLVLAKEEGLADYLIEDSYLKRCFVDHLFTNDISFEQFVKNDIPSLITLYNQEYQSEIIDNEVKLSCKFNLLEAEISLSKSFRLEDNFIKAVYQLSSTKPLNIKFGVENSFNFQAPHAEDRFITINGQRHDNSYLDSSGNYHEVKKYGMYDEYRRAKVELNVSRNGALYHHPLFTVSLSEGGFEKVYQGTTFLNIFDLELSESPIQLEFSLFCGKL